MEDDYQVSLEILIKDKQFMDSETFEKLVEYICENIVSSKLMDLLLEYFEDYPQQISCIPKRLIIHLISNPEEKLHPLVLFLVSRHDIGYNLDLDHLPIEKLAYLMSAFYQRIPLMICDPALVTNIKNKIDTYKMLIESPKWFSENEDFFIGLHAIEFDENECDELLTKLKTKWLILKMSRAAVSFVDLVASKCNRELEFNQYLIQVLFSLLPETDNITWLTNQIISNLKLLEGTNCSLQINDWNALAKKAITYGLKDEDPEFGFIRVFKSLIKKANVDACIVKELFEILAGYSQFTTIMLSRDSEVQKEIVLKLVKTLVKKEPSIMILSHVPLYLCSYNASLSTTDQILLKILFHYEENSIPVSNYRPYLWGKFAINHYQVKNHLISNTLNNIPSTTQVLSYVPLKRIRATLSMFPFDRMLHIQNQKITCYKTNRILEPRKMIDPAFLLPMISSLLATEAPLSIEKFTRSGCLSLVLACLGSSNNAMRSAAYHVLKLLRSHLFSRRAENLFWDHFINWVSGGIQKLKTKSNPPRLSMVQALILSKMVLAIANHEKFVDSTCSKILLSRPAAQFKHIPELKTFMESISGPREKQLHLHWFFETIKDGLRSSCDWQVLKEMNLLNILLLMFRTRGLKKRSLILDIMKSVFTIEPATNGGTGHWAIGFMVMISKCIESLSPVEAILCFECLQVLSKSSFIGNYAIDFWLSLFLEHGKDHNISLVGYETLKNLVSKYKNVHEYINIDSIEIILLYGQISKTLPDNEVFQCISILNHGFSGFNIEKTNSYIFLPTMIQILNKTNV